MKLKITAAIAALIGLTGCGSITRGTSETVTVTSSPADAAISTSNGQRCPRSPCTFTVSRKEVFTAYAEKPGYHSGSLEIKTKVSGGGAAGFAGNVVAGGIVGMGVDVATGAALDHYPNPAHIELKRIGAQQSAKPVKNTSKKKAGKPTV